MSIPNSEQSISRKHAYFMVEHSDNQIIHINANCILKLIYEYIRLKAGIPDSMEMDLCDDEGVPKSIYEAPEGACGLDFFEHRHMYYIVILERTKYGTVSNPRVLLSTNHRHFGKMMKAMGKMYGRQSEHSSASGSWSDSIKGKRKMQKKKLPVT